MMNYAIDPGPSVKYILSVLKGPGLSKAIYLDVEKEYLLGREKSCDIMIDQSDKSVSRKHAMLKVTTKAIIIENLSQTNPVMINGKPIQSFVLKGNGQFHIGKSLFDVRQAEKKGLKPVLETSSAFRALFFIVFFIVFITGVYFVIFRDIESPSNQDVPTKSSPGNLVPDQIKRPRYDADPNTLSIAGIKVSKQDMKQADEHFRQGMFFYDAGNMSRAVDQWGKSIGLYPDHPEAMMWLLKAERELEEQTKVHYQNAMTYYKYMRYKEASHEFMIVIQLSRNKNSDIYKDSRRFFDEIQKK